VKQVLVDDGRAVGVKVAGGAEYRATRGVISNIDAKRLFLHRMDDGDVDATLRDRLNRRIVIDKLAEYAPNVKTATIARRVESPAELGERLGALKGNCYHIDMTLEPMVFFRLLPEFANYETPIAGLYLTGAGTHPGGSISGMPGRNCARMFCTASSPSAKNCGKLEKNWAGSSTTAT
jgi:phytoene dehydrogenase-like protein